MVRPATPASSTRRRASSKPSDAARPDRRAQLDGDGQAGALRGRARDRDRGVRVGDQRRAGARLHHLGHRAAHVEVDQVGAARGGRGRGGAHHVGVLAEELDGDRPARALVGVDDQQLLEGAPVAVVDGVRGDHLADRQAGAVALGLQAHEPVADPGQRREHDAVGDGDAAELPGVAEGAHGTRLGRSRLPGERSSLALAFGAFVPRSAAARSG